jgi:Tfp pilus assembly protein PilO
MSFLDQLNLRPQEKRILAAVLVAVLVLVSIFFVWPKLGQRPKLVSSLEASRKKLQSYQAEIARVPDYQARLRELEGQGSAVLREEQALQLQNTVQTNASAHSVPITSMRVGAPSPSTAATNAFFDEQAIILGVNTGERELVNFLHSLGTGNSMIRVRDMDLRPDPPRYKLNGSITLVASYQKKNLSPATTPRGTTNLVARATNVVAAPTNPVPRASNLVAASAKLVPRATNVASAAKP